ncbi:uncharacterized protein MONBRDRAFT_11351 [Monosiga brevicollis MX1]|uniref:Uncharacterized protein n=1 Tax=Monosiga brevicollis TaxID=81824 RepID=A9V8Z6_MONBE|nr:uncharacterized protein MONBRDRAFT_11351 [Monosiga brevicollis MX1]EDQ85964.1 predicted protein [Monosiga brevicollis MX1]|eukprot:XP_001749158.1 hypothetical protein [Monosiga brevicollis MX1]
MELVSRCHLPAGTAPMQPQCKISEHLLSHPVLVLQNDALESVKEMLRQLEGPPTSLDSKTADELARLGLMIGGFEPAIGVKNIQEDVTRLPVSLAIEWAKAVCADPTKLRLALNRISQMRGKQSSEDDSKLPEIPVILHRFARPPCIKKVGLVKANRIKANPPREPCIVSNDDATAPLRFNCIDSCTNDNCGEPCCITTGISTQTIRNDMSSLMTAHRALHLDIVRALLVVSLEDESLLTEAEETEAEEVWEGSPELTQAQARMAIVATSERAYEILASADMLWPIPTCFWCDEDQLPAVDCRAVVSEENGPKNEFVHKVIQPVNATLLQMCEHAMALTPQWKPCSFWLHAAAEPIDLMWRPAQPTRPAQVIYIALSALAEFIAECYVDNRHDAHHGDLDALLVVEEAIWRLCDGKATELSSAVAIELGFRGVVLAQADARLLARALRLPSLWEWEGYDECLYMAAKGLCEDAGHLEMRPSRRNTGVRSVIVYCDRSLCAAAPAQGFDSSVSAEDKYIIEVGERMLASDRASLEEETRGRDGPSAQTSLETGFYNERTEILRKRRYILRPLSCSSDNEIAITAQDMVQKPPDMEPGSVLSSELAKVLPLFAKRETVEQFAGFAATLDGASKALDFLTAEASKASVEAHELIGRVQHSLVQRPRLSLTCGSAALQIHGMNKQQASDLDELLRNDLFGEALAVWTSCQLRRTIFERTNEHVPLLATSTLLVVPSPYPTLSRPLQGPCPGTVVPPLPTHDVQLTIINLGRSSINRALGTQLALTVKKGLDVLRTAQGRRTSYIVWFVDNNRPFRFDLAIVREQCGGSLRQDEAHRWGRTLLAAWSSLLSQVELEVTDVEDELSSTPLAGLGVRASSEAAKRLLVVTWHHDFAREAEAAALRMLHTMWVSQNCEVNLRLHASWNDSGCWEVKTCS